MPTPEHIHPALWRATQLARASARVVPTGHSELSAQLPEGGWPIGCLTELLLPHPGSGEVRLLAAAIAERDDARAIALVQPPFTPHIAAWRQCRLAPERLLWVAPPRPGDALWAAEQILKHASCTALLCWLPQVRPESLRRLHLAAQASDTLFFVLRPAQAAHHASPAPLRLALAPAPNGLSIQILKRRGPVCDTPIFLPLDGTPNRAAQVFTPHAPLDRHPSPSSVSGQCASPVA
ncbi:translesion DNA synthesis-associated protein ImuA [Bordetella holmesii]|uniref:Cell division inhibitor protein n=2 Tax=Bordetella holmesii TaxID=35814 RepID=A0ABN0RYK8_9BORD|nr:translesion DNA synthesis-associated protein ImuA [Bordetella holmesii]AHV92562.1 putative cell division inhibitor protein [Bordetella holmesii ATCC 51541]AIT28383.1 putative cell division inhibitor protein [Bordetella holmesii 44057]EWM41172.1 putative cell division inhibitor protein [Bordetella holmesii 35009]EWM43599.1 putative cell division inhibitor protein [Bordetella holmesii 41130]AMD47049.1 cell division protein [Bordetella holmesii H558]